MASFFSQIRGSFQSHRQELQSALPDPASAPSGPMLFSYEMIKVGSTFGNHGYHFINSISNEVKYTMRSTMYPSRAVIHRGSSLENEILAIAEHQLAQTPVCGVDRLGTGTIGSNVDVEVLTRAKHIRTLTKGCIFTIQSSGRRLQWTRRIKPGRLRRPAGRSIILTEAHSNTVIAYFESHLGLGNTARGTNPGTLMWFEPVSLDEELAALAMCSLIFQRFRDTAEK